MNSELEQVKTALQKIQKQITELLQLITVLEHLESESRGGGETIDVN